MRDEEFSGHLNLEHIRAFLHAEIHILLDVGSLRLVHDGAHIQALGRVMQYVYAVVRTYILLLETVFAVCK